MGKIAVLGVDIQETFASTELNELPVPDAYEVVEPTNRLFAIADLKYLSLDSHLENTVEHFEKWGRHGVMGSPGEKLLPRLHAFNVRMVIKGRDIHGDDYSATQGVVLQSGMELADDMRHNEVTLIIVTGLAYNVCVAFTVIELAKAGFRVIVAKDACRPIEWDGMPDELTIQSQQKAMIDAGAEVRTTNEIVQLLKVANG